MIARYQRYLRGTGLGPILIKAVTGSTGVRLAGMGLAFLVGVQLARGLGAEGYGVYGLAMSIVALLNIPTQFGLPPLLTREVAASQAKGDWSKLRGILRWSNRTVMLISLAEAAVVSIVLLIFWNKLGGPLSETLLAGLIVVPIVAISSLQGAALRGLQHIVKGQLPELIFRPGTFSLLLFVVPLGSALELNPTTAMALHAGATAISLTFGALLLRRLWPAELERATPVTTPREWWASALPMALTQGARVLQGHLTVLLLGTLATAAVVGIFRVSTSIALSIAMPISLLNQVASPLIARLHAEGDHKRLSKMLGFISLAMVGGVIVATLPFLVAGEELLEWVFGAEFAKSNAPLLVICAGTAISAIGGANASVLNMTGHEKRVTRAFTISLVVLLVIAVPLIISLQDIGAAIAHSVALAVWNVLLWRDARVLLDVDTSFFSLLRVMR